MNAQSKESGDSPELLGVSEVLVGSLPGGLFTSEAPDRYTVEAVFTRKAERDEVVEIHGSGMRSYLSENGYPTVELRVSDRRLEIANTNLEELRDGLAVVIANRLEEMSLAQIARRIEAAALLESADVLEHDRAAAVVALAKSVSFTPGGRRTFSDDSARQDEWASEGGASSSERSAAAAMMP